MKTEGLNTPVEKFINNIDQESINSACDILGLNPLNNNDIKIAKLHIAHRAALLAYSQLIEAGDVSFQTCVDHIERHSALSIKCLFTTVRSAEQPDLEVIQQKLCVAKKIVDRVARGRGVNQRRRGTDPGTD